MAFKYITHSSNIGLEPDEVKLLESIDSFLYPSLNGISKLADLHSKPKQIRVVLKDKTTSRPFDYKMTSQQLNDAKKAIEKKIAELFKSIRQVSKEAHRFSNDFDNELWKEKFYLEYLYQLFLLQKELYDNAISLPNDEYRILGKSMASVFGEYDGNQQVILYYETIKASERLDENRRNLLAVVYVHEMMHAYLDNGCSVISKIEEPIVESAMLDFFKAYDHGIFEYAKKHVEAKQACMGVAHYGFGYYIFNNPNGVDWIEDYKSVKRSLADTDSDVVAYLDYWKTGSYPLQKEKDCLYALDKALHGGRGNMRKFHATAFMSKVPIVNDPAMKGKKNNSSLVIDKWMVMEGKKLLIGTTEAEFEDFLNRHNIVPNSKTSFLGSLKRQAFKDLLAKHGLPTDVYQCYNYPKIMEVFMELSEGKTNLAIKANVSHDSTVSALRYLILLLLEKNGIMI